MKRKTSICISVILLVLALHFFDYSFEWYINTLPGIRSDIIIGGVALILFLLLSIVRIVRNAVNADNAYQTVIIILWAFFVIIAYDKRKDFFSDFIFPVLIVSGTITLIILILLKKDCHFHYENEIEQSLTDNTERKYRDIFYSLPFCFSKRISDEDYIKWFDELCYADETEKMLCFEFIKEFNITKEEFNILNHEYAEYIRTEMGETPCIAPEDYPEQERTELFNADVIYSFDYGLIRNYYLKPKYKFSSKEEFEKSNE